ncbi:hypothetical protein D3C86_1868560 [compost metagenome]
MEQRGSALFPKQSPDTQKRGNALRDRQLPGECERGGQRPESSQFRIQAKHVYQQYQFLVCHVCVISHRAKQAAGYTGLNSEFRFSYLSHNHWKTLCFTG